MSSQDFLVRVIIPILLEKTITKSYSMFGSLICVYNISRSLAGNNAYIQALRFPHLLLAFKACTLLEAHGDIHTNY